MKKLFLILLCIASFSSFIKCDLRSLSEAGTGDMKPNKTNLAVAGVDPELHILNQDQEPEE